MMDSGDEARQLAEQIIGLGKDELARRIKDELTEEVRRALRGLLDPRTGEPLGPPTGVSVTHPPRHETGSLTEK
ncbi:hypothetical protein SAMN06265365_11096 [Tistlia consotensis]|uniref:Uncharacterized protein n=1 Tax=Tistlia consotensis USBA 355 TaxID=560819 RepID=A0A1Y6BVC1_9PROT|nr:hypothetical protein [Tistlia consotensis]SMF27147.1 hypothetical protein SAMN05428998_10960 [Tistlia consotensis USBA 355]SNR66446.1 hypothetical protein SAMN06265365_11096 [Tistlia consotensis]